MKNETPQTNTYDEPTVLNYIRTRYSLTPIEKVGGGHTGATIYSCEDPFGTKKVVKFGLNNSAKEEVENNILGYEGIKEAGGKDLLPSNIIFDRTYTSPIIIMDYLGNSLAELARQSKQPEYLFDTFYSTLRNVGLSSTTAGSQEHIDGIEEIKSQIRKWWIPLNSANLLADDSEQVLEDVESTSLSSNNSGLMILDFTPDNFFRVDNRVVFIDPWKQKSYRGTLIPPLAQFITLAKDIYHLPSIQSKEFDLQQLVEYLGSLLNLDKTQVDAQFKLGSALQLALSSFVRLETNPKLAEDFAQMSYKLIESI